MKKILVVEDDEVERELMRMTLERAGYEVVAAEDGARGFELAASTKPARSSTRFISSRSTSSSSTTRIFFIRSRQS